VCVDTAPILERALAASAGAGFIGKSSMFIHKTHGTFLMLGEILSTRSTGEPAAQFPQTPPNCGSCQRCQTYCPTGALNTAYTLDARRCLSYYTIEHRGTIPVAFWPWLRFYMFGCDICQLACPKNRSVPAAPVRTHSRWGNAETAPSLLEIVQMSERDYANWFGGSPLTRAKREGLQRNALIAMVAKADPRLDDALAFVETSGGAVLKATAAQRAEFFATFGAHSHLLSFAAVQSLTRTPIARAT
jgi:epoxyqueuosine reductase